VNASAESENPPMDPEDEILQRAKKLWAGQSAGRWAGFRLLRRRRLM